MVVKKTKANWMSDDLLERIKLKDSLLRKERKTSKEGDWEQAQKLKN